MKTKFILTAFLTVIPALSFAADITCEGRVRNIAKEVFKANGEGAAHAPVVRMLSAADSESEEAMTDWQAVLKGNTYLITTATGSDENCIFAKIEAKQAIAKAAIAPKNSMCKAQANDIVNKIVSAEKGNNKDNAAKLTEAKLVKAADGADPVIDGSEVWQISVQSNESEYTYHVTEVYNGADCVLGAVTMPYAD